MTDSGIGRTESPHFDEMTALLYLEQQLDDDRSKLIGTHANTCATCRELLRVLKNEGVWLREAILADEEPVPARLIASPERGSAPWGWLVTLGFGAAGAYTLWNGVVDPWMNRASDIGFTQGNLMTMLFFSGAFWSGWNDVLNGIGVLAALTLGGIAVWALRRFFRRQTRVATVMGMLAFLLLIPWTAHAADTEHGSPSYTLAAGQEIKTDLIVTADRTQIDGDIDGDLIAFSHEVEVNGHIKGDIIAFAQDLTVNGTVDGNVRVFAQSAILSGAVGKNLMGFANRVVVDEKSGVGGSATLFGQDLQLIGAVKGDLLAFAQTMDAEGPIGGNVKVRGENFRIGSTAQIAGRTEFEGPKQADVASGAKLASPVEFTMRQERPQYSTWTYYWHQTLRWGAAFLLGMVMFLLAPGPFLDTANSAKKAGLAMGVGLLFLVGTPVAAVIACVTIVGLGVGIVTFLVYLVALYISQIFVGAWLGEKLLGAGIGIGPVLARLALGLAILRLVRIIPVVGPLSVLVVCVWGLGAYVLTVHKRMRQQVVAA
jgi:cytoskeletal protein CcmA (bactofilin family)